jgi:hypothetical protein
VRGSRMAKGRKILGCLLLYVYLICKWFCLLTGLAPDTLHVQGSLPRILFDHARNAYMLSRETMTDELMEAVVSS